MHACQSVVSYEQRNPAATQLYKVISENLNSFLAERSEEGRNLPKFISRFGENGTLVQFDYEAFHLRLAGKLMDYQLPPTSLHTYLAAVS